MKKIFNSFADHILGDLDRVNDRGLTRLQQAVIDDDIDRVKTLIKLKADINHTGLNGDPPLHRAILGGRVGIATLLIKAGADVNLINKSGYTPLHKAVMQGETAVVRQLLDHGADVNARDREGRTALHLLPGGLDDCAALLAEYGADLNAADLQGRRPLHCYLKYAPMLKRLLALGARPHLGGPLGTPLALALTTPLAGTHPDSIRLLVQAGSSIDTRSASGETLLHVAARTGQSDLFIWALAQGADPDLRDKDGNTVLHALMRLPQPQLVQTLLKKAPHLAGEKNLFAVAPLSLLTADLVATPLRGAETYISTLNAVAKMLVTHGADASVTGGPAREALLHQAVSRNMIDLITHLAHHKADLNVRDGKGQAALHLAVEARALHLVDQLLDDGADPDLVDKQGWTLLDRLAEKKDRDSPIVQRLIVAGGQYNKQLPLYPDLIRPRRTAEPAPEPTPVPAPVPSKKIIRKPSPPAA